jgi:hypothetical protein
MSIRVAAAVISFSFVLLAGAREPVVAQEARLVGRLPEAPRAQLEAMLASARSAGLPAEPLVDRALEGVAKGARPELIITAVTRLLEELRQTRQAFGSNSSAAELVAGASALRAGATSADLARLRKLRAEQSLTIAAGVFADLVAAGVPADTGIAAVLALAPDAADAEYIAFRRNVERDIALGASPASSVGARLRAVGEATDGGMSAPGGHTNTDTRSSPRKRKP